MSQADTCRLLPLPTTSDGFSAACGKLGALLPTVVFHYLSDRNKFWFAMPFGALGVIVTALFLPDTTGLELREIERAFLAPLLHCVPSLDTELTLFLLPLCATGYWRCVRAGHPELYHGIAIHPHHLSWYERVVLKRDRYYDPKQDKLDRIEEVRALSCHPPPPPHPS